MRNRAASAFPGGKTKPGKSCEFQSRERGSRCHRAGTLARAGGKAHFLPVCVLAWPRGDCMEGKAERSFRNSVWVCVCVLVCAAVGFSCFLGVCFCCKLQPDVCSWAPPHQLEVVIRCCPNCAFCEFFSLCPFRPLSLGLRAGSHSPPSQCPRAALFSFHHKHIQSSQNLESQGVWSWLEPERKGGWKIVFLISGSGSGIKLLKRKGTKRMGGKYF